MDSNDRTDDRADRRADRHTDRRTGQGTGEPPAADPAERVRDLLKEHGRTYAEEAGIRLLDKPSPLYRLLVLTTLLSKRISSGVAIAAARELFSAGYRTPAAMQASTWEDRVHALGRGHYRRYDESTARLLAESADQVIGQYHGDLRRLRDQAHGESGGIAVLLQQFSGIGPAGASIYLREVQEVWPSVAPYIDDRIAEGARRAGLPAGRADLVTLMAESAQPSRLGAALVRVSLGRRSSPRKKTAER